MQYRQEYERLRQRNDESIDAYRLRFDEVVNNLPARPADMASHFALSLNNECAEIIAHYDDITDEKTTIQVMTQRIARRLRAKRIFHPTTRNSLQSRINEPLHQRISNGNNRNKVRQPINNNGNNGPNGIAKNNGLTPEQKQRLEKLIKDNGGKYVGKAIENNKEWFKMAVERGLCKTCAGKGHTARNCPVSQRYREQMAKIVDRYTT